MSINNSSFFSNCVSAFSRLLRYGSIKPMYQWSDERLMKADLSYYRRKMGYSFDIMHPELFTEKIQWYKFFYDRADFSDIVDKVRFKDYIRENLGEGYTIPMYGAWDNVDGLEHDWDTLPEELVLKANLQSDDNGIKMIHNRSGINFSELKKELSSWLAVENTLMNSCDRKFYMSKPMILAEKFMSDGTDRLTDYKFFCFDGVPYCMYVDVEHNILFYDMEFKKLDVRYGHYGNDAEIKCPVHFEEMKAIASKLSSGIPFVRVDMYEIGDKVYLGEMTFNPGGGFNIYDPLSFNRELGEKFILPAR